MQKAHSRINWENLPSINTPLGANNLNKMDKALDVIDDRVLALYGYQDRVAQSEKNAKASENNAKTSETNAKQSELKAKEYAEHAFSGTPDGYEQLVEDVRLMDIQITTDTTLANSKAGGYKLLSMTGKTEQRTTTGKNLLENVATTVTKNGVTFTVNSDESITVNGTATADTDLYVKGSWSNTDNILSVDSGTFILSGTKTSSITAFVIKNSSALKQSASGSDIEFSVDSGGITAILYRVPSGATLSNYKIYPMIRLASITDGTYEPFTNGASPNPEFPQSLNHTGDVVELEQGTITKGNGVTSSATNRVRSKNYVHCNGGDSIAISTEDTMALFGFYYYDDNNTYISEELTTTLGNSFTGTVPSGATKFKFAIGKGTDVSPSTVGKITLTINDKYVLQFKTNGKNLFDENAIMSGYELVSTSGAITKNTSFCVSDYMPISPSTAFYLTKGDRGASICFYDKDMNYISTVTKTKGVVTSPNNENVAYMRINCALTELEGVQVELGTVATEYEPYQEKVATVLLNAPLRESDVMDRTEVVRKRAKVRIEAGSNWSQQNNSYDTDTKLFFAGKINSIPADFTGYRNALCTHFPLAKGTVQSASVDIEAFNFNATKEYSNYICFKVRKEVLTSEDLDGWNAFLTDNEVYVEYELAEEVIEELDTDSQIALNSLETFDTVTYINVDSRVQPSEIKGEYGTSKVGAYTLKSLLNSETNAIKIEDAINTMLLIGAE